MTRGAKRPIKNRKTTQNIAENRKKRKKFRSKPKTEIKAFTDKALHDGGLQNLSFRYLIFIRLNLFYFPKFLLRIPSLVQNSSQKVWKGGPDPTFPLLFHENPTSRTFFTTISNPVFLSQKNTCTLKSLISTKANAKANVV